jgi:hypothetical protein
VLGQHLAPPWPHCLRTQGHPVCPGGEQGAPPPPISSDTKSLGQINRTTQKTSQAGGGRKGWVRPPSPALCLRYHRGPSMGPKGPHPLGLNPRVSRIPWSAEAEPGSPAQLAEALQKDTFLILLFTTCTPHRGHFPSPASSALSTTGDYAVPLQEPRPMTRELGP